MLLRPFYLIIIAFAIFISHVELQKSLPDKLRSKLTGFAQRKLDRMEKLQKIKPGLFQNIDTTDVRLRATTDQLSDYYGYKSEKHWVKTADGYILTLHRIAGKKSEPSSKGKPVVYLQHGFMSSSIDWILAGPKRSLACMLADLGFDVWLGNARGSTYSRAHATLSPKDEKFWDFSWHEIGVFDLPASIDYILAVTGNKKLTYIGHSQGTTVSYVLLSERPEYNYKISKLISLAPVVYGVPASPLVRPIAPLWKTINKLSQSIEYNEFRELNDPVKTFVFYFCNKNAAKAKLCRDLIFLVAGKSEELYDSHLYPIIFQHFPGGSSVKQGIHYAQITKSGIFRQYDYGKPMNEIKYGSAEPPEYKIENIKVPTTLFIGANDLLSQFKEGKKFYDKLPNPNGLIVVPHPTFNHLDFFWGIGVERLLYDRVISVITNGYY